MLDYLTQFVSYARIDTHAQRFKRGNEWAYKPVAGPIRYEELEKHLGDGPHIGVYVMPAGAKETKLGAFDLDAHAGETTWDDMAAIADRLVKTARSFGLNAWPVRSGGGNGIHLFFRWDAAQSARAVRTMLSMVLAAEGLRDGVGGVARNEVEIFPKQDQVEKDGYGALIAVPFARQSVALDLQFRSVEQPISWLSSVPLDPIEDEPERADGLHDGSRDAATIETALSFIDNGEDLDYEVWVKVGLALKGALGDEGRQLFLDWSAQSDKNVAGTTERKWRTFKPVRIGAGTIFHLAKQAGWQGSPHESPIFSDDWLALKFAAENATDIRYTTLWTQWHNWIGSHWKRDDTMAVYDRVRTLCRSAAQMSNKKKSAIASAKTVNAVSGLIRSDRRLVATIDQWDQDPWLLATPGGTIDLHQGQLRSSEISDYLTRVTSVTPGGECPAWHNFLGQILANDMELKAYLQRVLGYCLTGSVREEALFFFHGGGGNGKGTFIETVANALGEHSTTVGMSTLMKTKHQEHPTEIAKLKGIRLAVASETTDGARWDTARIKVLTGGDRLTGRFMRADFFDFVPTHKLVVSGNRKPMLGTVDHALTRRMHFIPFSVQIDKPDKTLKERLQAEAAGILSWMIEGCLIWQRSGLAMPGVVRAATDKYLREQDDVQLWLEDATTEDAGSNVHLAWLYNSWQDWCSRNGAWAGSNKELSQRLQSRGYEVKKVATGTVVRGLRQGALQGEYEDEGENM